MIRGIGDALSSTYSQTLNGYDPMITCVNFWEATEQTHKQADRQAGREHTSTNKSLDIIACSLTHRHDDSHIFGLYRTITNTHIGL